MLPSIFVQPELATMIIAVIEELATEIDLNYEDEELPGCAPAFAKMEALVNALKSCGFQPPEAYAHILDRYTKSTN